MEKDLKIEIGTSRKQKYKFTVSLNKFALFKLILVFPILILITVNTLYGIGLPKNNHINCIIDLGFQLTNSINQDMINIPLFRYCILGFGSILLDISFISTLIYWGMKSNSWRLPITLGLFYGVRGIIQKIYQMDFPEGFLWEFPYVPSLVVSYLKTNDFFFSGHVGMPIIAGLELFKSNLKPYACFCFFTACYEAFLVLITRVHFTIDIIVGIVFAHYIFMIAIYWFKSVSSRLNNIRDIKSKVVLQETNKTENEGKNINNVENVSKKDLQNEIHTEENHLTKE